MKMMRFVFVLLAVVLTMSGLVSADCKVPMMNNAYPWPVYAGLGIIIAFTTVALAYMVSSAFGSSEMKAWVANEFWQAITTTLIVAFLLIAGIIESLAVPAFGYTDPHASGADISPVTQSEIIPSTPVLANAYVFMKRAWSYATGTAFISMVGQSEFLSVLRGMELSFSRNIPMLGFYINLKNAIPEFISGTFGKVFGYITDPLIGVAGIMTAQMFILCLIDYVGMTLLLPLGIVLRAVPFLRGLGTALIALTIGLFLVYPMTLLFNEKMVLMLNPDKVPGGVTAETWWKNVVPPDAAVYFGSSMVSSGTQVFISMSQVVNKALPPWFINSFRTFNVALIYFSMAGAVHMALLLVDRASFVIVVLGAVLPFLSIVITFGITREIAKILGSDINLNTLLKIL
jgi:hypothetical protein